MDIKKLLTKIENCKKDSQKKELVKTLCTQLSNPKNNKVFESFPKYNYEKTIKILYSNKEFDLFLELVTSVIKYIPSLSDQYRKNYQESILNLIIPKIENNSDLTKNNLNYFLIATKDLEDINNIKNKEYLIYYIFFNILIKLKLEVEYIDLLLKLGKYMSNNQYEITLYVLTIYALNIKKDNSDDLNEQMLILSKIIDFYKVSEKIYLNNYEITKIIFLMLFLNSPFKQKILVDFYDNDPNLFIKIIDDIIYYIKNKFKDLYLNELKDNNSINNNSSDKNKNDLVYLNHFFSDDISKGDIKDLNLNKNILYNYFNNKIPLIKEYNNFINRINLNQILEKNKIIIIKGIIWTISALIIKNYNTCDKFQEKQDLKIKEIKNNSFKLFISLISLFNYIDAEIQNIFISQYLDLVKSILRDTKSSIEDWTHILDIINMCLDVIIKKDERKEAIEKKYKKEINILNEIFTYIFNIYNSNDDLLHCDLSFLSLLLHKFNQYLQNDILLCFYINIYILNEHKNKKYKIESNNYKYKNFINNLETLVYNVFSLSPSSHPNAKNYLMEIIRSNYINDNNNNINEEKENNIIKKEDNKEKKNNISKRNEIEKVLEKYLEYFFISFGNNEVNFSFFNYVLTEILIESYDIKFIDRIITTLIFINNSNINKDLYNTFIEQILGNLFEKIINYSTKYSLSKEKFNFLFDFFYEKNKMNDKNILKLAIKLLKCFKVNNQNEVIFVNTKYGDNDLLNNINYNQKHSMIVIDYNYNKILQKKKEFKDDKEYDLYHKNFYSPYTLFQHVNLFSSLNYHFINNIKTPLIVESILEFYYLCLNKNLYFLKNINFKEFFNILFKEKDITKISISKKSTHYLLKILASLPYHIHNEISFNSSKYILKIKNSSYNNNDVQLFIEPKNKILIINLLLSFWNTLIVEVNTCLKKIFSNEKFTQTIINNNNNYNENSIEKIVNNIIDKGESYLWCGELNLYTKFEYIYKCIKILKLYLISNANDILFIRKNSLNYNYNEKKIKESIHLLFNNNSSSITFIKSIILKILNLIFGSLNYKYFNKKYAFFILSLLYEIKELIILFVFKDEKKSNINNTKRSFSNTNLNSQHNNILNINNEKENEGLNMIYKTIFISMFLSWNNEDKIIEKFDKYLNTNYKKKLTNKEKYICLKKYYKENINFDEDIQDFIENISDSLNLYLMEYIPPKNASILIDIIDEIFPNPISFREYFFYKMTEWTLKIKKNRDALNIDYRNIYDTKFLNNKSSFGEDKYIGEKLLKDSQVFFGNNSLIIINPLSLSKCCFTLRNPISHMNLIFDSNMPIINNSNIKEEIDKEFEEDDDDENEKKYQNNNKNLKQELGLDISNSFTDSFDSEYEEFKKNDDEIMPAFLRKETSKNLDTKYNLKNENNESNTNDNFEYRDSSGDILWPTKKNSENNINKKYEINSNLKNKTSSKEIEVKLNKLNKNYNQNIMKKKRYNSDLNIKFKDSVLFYEQKKKMMQNCLKLFSIMAELTDYKVEKYKWIDITQNNNLFNITKFIQYLDLLPVYFCYNCGLIYYYNSKTDSKCLASYMYFIEKFGLLYDYYDFYPDKNKKDLTSKLINKNTQKDKYIVINQDSLIRINFHILNLTEKDKNKIIEENNIIFIWIDNSNNSYDYNTNVCHDKIKVFFIIYKITENYYKIRIKYNQMAKKEIEELIEEIFVSDFIIDIENQSSIQLLFNMIIHIEILIKSHYKKLELKKNEISFVKKQKDSGQINNEDLNKNKEIDNNSVQNIVMDDYINSSGCNNFEEKDNYLYENDFLDQNTFSFKKRYELINKLFQD